MQCGSRDAVPPEDWFTPARFAAVLAFLLVATFPQLWTGAKTLGYLDFGQFALPVAYYHREAFWRGELPLWNPLSNCGTPFLAQWNTLTLYPPSLFYLLLPFPWSLNVFCLLHLFLGGFGMYWLAARWTGNRTAAAVAGAVFAFNGLSWYGLIWPHIISALGWMPWVIWSAERAIDSKSHRDLALAALIIAAQLLSGGAEVILLTWLTLAVIIPACHAGGTLPAVRAACRLIIVGLLGTGLAAVQIAPFLDLLLQSQRSSGYSDPDLGSMPLTGWANYLVPIFRCLRNPQGLWVPPNHWAGSYYLGIGTVALALIGVWRSHTRRVIVLLCLGMFGLLMALGGHGQVYRWVTSILPVLGFLRFPVKFVIIATFAIPTLAAFGLAWALRRPSTGTMTLRWVGSGLAVGIGLIVFAALKSPLVLDSFNPTFSNALVRGLLLALILLCVCVLRRATTARARPYLSLGLVGLCWVDVATHNTNLSPSLPVTSMQPGVIREFFHWDSQLSAGNARVMQSPAAYNRLMSAAYQNLELDTSGRRLSQFMDFNLLDLTPKVDGFYSLELKEYSRLFQELYYGTNQPWHLLDFLSVARVTSPTNLVDWLPRNSWLPLVTAGQQPVFTNSEAALSAVLSPSFEPGKIIYLPTEASAEVTTRLPANASVTNYQFASHKIEFDVATDQPTVAAMAQSFCRNWRAYVDGQRVTIWRANFGFQAINIPTGNHHVRVVYVDRALHAGALISLLSLLVCGTLLWRGGIRRPSKAKSTRAGGE